MKPDSIIIVVEAPWALEPLRDGGFLTVELMNVSKIVAAADLIETDVRWCDLGIGVFAYADAVPSALDAAAQRPWGIGALVVMDGTFDAALASRVRCPTLFIVTSSADELIRPAREACERLGEWGEVACLETAAEAALLGRAWFGRHLGAAQRDPFAPRSPRSATGAYAMHLAPLMMEERQ